MAAILNRIGRRCHSICKRELHAHAVLYERLRVNAIPLRSRKIQKSSEDKMGKHFVDNTRVTVKGGNGGEGSISMASVFAEEFAGPDGGNGGNGGHVIFRASSQVSSLSHIKSLIKAPDGVAGGSRDLDGRNSDDRIVDVPVGTIIRNLDREILAELVTEGSMMIAARGGAGGKGNAYFKTATCQTPQVAEAGGIGEEFTLMLELRTMAHFGLIGFPNAGKSTLLRAISRARPRVAAYPFTTLQPHIGMVPYDDFVQLSVADIPGIIQDAHKNKGLGISFLRHIERCWSLLYVVDMSVPDAFDQFTVLRSELEHYKTGLSNRPHAVIANKMDLDSSNHNLNSFTESVRKSINHNIEIFPVSGKFCLNLAPLLIYLRRIHDEVNRK